MKLALFVKNCFANITAGKCLVGMEFTISSEDQLKELSKEELIDKIRKLQIHVKQLRNVIIKKENLEKSGGHSCSKSKLSKRQKKGRSFDFAQ